MSCARVRRCVSAGTDAGDSWSKEIIREGRGALVSVCNHVQPAVSFQSAVSFGWLLWQTDHKEYRESSQVIRHSLIVLRAQTFNILPYSKQFLAKLPSDEDDDADPANENSSVLGATMVTDHSFISLWYRPSATAVTLNTVVPSSDHCTTVPAGTDGDKTPGLEKPSVV